MSETAAQDHREIEWQFDAADLDAVAGFLEGSGRDDGLSVEPAGDLRIVDTYYDTSDWRVMRAGYAARVRRVEGDGAEATMKLLARGDPSGLKVRREISCPVGEGESPLSAGAVGERLGYLAGNRKLKVLFEVRTRRRVYEISLGGRRLGEVTLDDTRVCSPDGGRERGMMRVEVEVEDAAHPALGSFVDGLREACGLEPATRSKFGTGLEVAGLEPPGPPSFGPTGFGAGSTTGEAAFAVLRRHFAEFLSHEGGVRLGEDPEELHDMRVAGRRVRAAIKLFDRALPVKLRSLERDLGWILGVLGGVRDLDVLLEKVEGGEVDPAGGGEGTGRVVEEITKRREEARRELLRALDSRRYARFVGSFSELLRAGPTSSVAARRPVLESAPRILGGAYRRVRRAGDGLTPDSPAEDFHRLRKRARRLRYALEFLEPVYGKPARRLARRLKGLQDVLGEHQDAFAAAGHLRGLALESGRRLPAEVVFVMGALSGGWREKALGVREDFPAAYDRLRGKRWRRLEAKMERMNPAGGGREV
ncbi:MAG: CHAD domain-containing protein [Rubrobacteraceae bacterium]|nr:CHAD domain-containing protein [Rubrobacteraceae bacterium]